MNFSYNAETSLSMSEEEIEAHTMGVVLIDFLNTKKGINVFGKRAETAVMKYIKNIHDMNTYKPMDASKLT